jgi:hypothetical protein
LICQVAEPLITRSRDPWRTVRNQSAPGCPSLSQTYCENAGAARNCRTPRRTVQRLRGSHLTGLHRRMFRFISEFAHAAHTRTVDLDQAHSFGLDKILKHCAVGYVFSQRQGNGSDLSRKHLMAKYVVRMRWLLNSITRYMSQLAACLNGLVM